MKVNPKISIIIPRFLFMECSATKNYPYVQNFEPTEACLNSIKKQDYKNIEVILANPKNCRSGFEAKNKAVKKAKGDIILFMCPESVMVKNNELSNLIKIFNKTKADAVGCSSIANKDMNLFIWLLESEVEIRESMMREGWTDIASWSYMAIKKSVFDEIGGFPKDSPTINLANKWAGSIWGDWDFCSLLKEKKYKIWHTNKVHFYHYYRTDFDSYFKKQFNHAWYNVAFYKRFGKSDDYTHHAFIPRLDHRRTKSKKIFLLIPIALLRYVSWVLGAAKGVWDFYIMKKYLSS